MLMQPEFLHKQSLHHSIVCVPTFNASEQKCSNRWTKPAVGSCRLFRASMTQWNCKSSKCPTSWRSSTKSSDSSFSFSESITSFLVNTTIAFSSSLSSAWYENDTMLNLLVITHLRSSLVYIQNRSFLLYFFNNFLIQHLSMKEHFLSKYLRRNTGVQMLINSKMP